MKWFGLFSGLLCVVFNGGLFISNLYFNDDNPLKWVLVTINYGGTIGGFWVLWIWAKTQRFLSWEDNYEV